jgi:hypothetical protein
LIDTTIVPKEHIKIIWHQIKEYAEKCAKYTYGRYTADDILEGLLTKDQQLWVPFNVITKEIIGFWVTEVVEYPQMNVLVLHFVGGKDFPSWTEKGFPKLQKFAKETGCKIMESYGRPGWEVMWKDHGYKKRFVFYELPVE